MRKILTWLSANSEKAALTGMAFYLALLGLASFYGFQVDRHQDVEACNRSNRTIERAIKVGGESIIEASAKISDRPPSPEAIQIYRRIIDENIDKALEDC